MKKEKANKKIDYENNDWNFDLDLNDEDIDRMEIEATQRFKTPSMSNSNMKKEEKIDEMELSYINMNENSFELDNNINYKQVLMDRSNERNDDTAACKKFKKNDSDAAINSDITYNKEETNKNNKYISSYVTLHSLKNVINNMKNIFDESNEINLDLINNWILQLISTNLLNQKMDIKFEIYDSLNLYILNYINFVSSTPTLSVSTSSSFSNHYSKLISFLHEFFIIIQDDFKAYFNENKIKDSIILFLINVLEYRISVSELDKISYLILIISSSFSWKVIIESPLCFLYQFCNYFENYEFQQNNKIDELKIFKNIVFTIDDIFQMCHNNSNKELIECSLKCSCMTKYLSVFVYLTYNNIININEYHRNGQFILLEQSIDLLYYCISHLYLLESYVNKNDPNYNNLHLNHLYVLMAGVPLLHKYKKMTSSEVIKLDEMLILEPSYDR